MAARALGEEQDRTLHLVLAAPVSRVAYLLGRGAAVKKLLVDNGVPEALLQVISKGDLESSADNEEGRSKERRVQFVWP